MTPVSAYTPDSGDASYDVESYALDLTYRVRTNRLEGRAQVNAVLALPASAIRLDLVGLRVSRVRVDGEPASFRQDVRSVTVDLPARRQPGERFSVDLAYGGSPRPRRTPWGTLGWEELADGALVAAQPIGAPTWFPCNDRPDDRATYRVTIATDAPYRAVVSGIPLGTERQGRLEARTFELRVPTPTYLVAVHVGRFAATTLPAAGMTAELIHPPALRRAAEQAFGGFPAMIATLEEVFGPYPQDTCTIVVTEDALEIPLEAQGMALFGANHLDPSFERLVVHELAHQWVGNSVGLQDWQDIWLNEGFACYAEWLWSEASGGPSASDLARGHHDRLRGEPEDLVVADPGPDRMFDDRVYKRGALALHALRLTTGDDAFFAFVRGWVTAHRHEVVTDREFRDAAAGALGAEAGPLLAGWLDRAPLPDLPPAPGR